MQKLGLKLQNNGTISEQVKRTKNCALYKTGRGDFEVFKIKVSPAQEIYGKEYPERETYPSNEDFGKTAWYYTKEENALAKYEWLVENHG